ncbi:MAG: helix-hairpin-helix domain-containing protein [Chlorobi bacterium]|nr:helix-hairpin-helix domain-containing protein [Chlorobiota bacterium]
MNKSQLRGTIILSVLIAATLVFKYFLTGHYQYDPGKLSDFQKEIELFRQQQQQVSDSIAIENLQNRGKLSLEQARKKLHPFFFNPNNLPDESWKKLGLTDKQIRSIKKYESKGYRFYRKEDFRNLYCISDAEYQVLMPYISIPEEDKRVPGDFDETYYRAKKKRKNKKEPYKTVEINAADSLILVKNLKLPPWLAVRTIKYRELVGGFYDVGQLADVYGIDSYRVKKLRRFIEVDTTVIKTININKEGFKKISAHPYFSNQIAKEIISRRLEKGNFTDKRQLVDEGIVSEALFQKIRHYIRLK